MTTPTTETAPTPDRKPLDAEQARAYLRDHYNYVISERQLRRLESLGAIIATRPSPRKATFYPDDLDAFMAQARQRAAEAAKQKAKQKPKKLARR